MVIMPLSSPLKSAFRTEYPAQPGVKLCGVVCRARKGFKEGFGNMMAVPSILEIQMERGPAMTGESEKKRLNELDIKGTNPPWRYRHVIHEVRPLTEINDYRGKRFFEWHACR